MSLLILESTDDQTSSVKGGLKGPPFNGVGFLQLLSTPSPKSLILT